MDEPSSTDNGAITLRIKFKTESLDDFVAKYGGDVSAGGIFIRTKQPLAVGTLLNFEFSLSDSSLLMSGLGTVVWLREHDPARPSSVPGMGLRFDQLSPESQAMHQQLLAHKARREGKAAAAAPAPAAKPGSGSNKSLPRQSASSPLLTPTAASPALAGGSSDTMNALEEFDSGGKTEIASHPPSFFFEAAEKARAAAEASRATARQAQASAPAKRMDDWQTDAQELAKPEHTVTANSLDLAWMHDEQGEPPSPDAPMAPMDDVMQTGELQTAMPHTSAADLPRAALLDLPMGDESSSLPDGGSFAEPVPTETLSLDSSAIEAIKAGPDDAAPVEAPDEKTDQVTVAAPEVREQSPIEKAMRGLADELPKPAATHDDKAPKTAAASAEVEAVAAGAGALAEKKGGGGKTLVVVGLLAAALAFTGVYLLHTKPWQSGPAPTPTANSATPAAPVPTPPAVEPKPAEIKPAEVPAQPVEAEPAAKPSEAKPSEAKPAEPEVKTAPIEAKPVEAKPVLAKVTEPKHEESAEKAAKDSPRPAPGKKNSNKTPEASPVPVSVSDPAAPVDVKYILKVRSVPAGGDVLIDGERMGPTPFQRRILDFSKPHSLAVRKPGYEPFERSIAAGDDWIVKGEDAVLTVTAKLAKSKVEEPAAPSAPAQPSSDDLHP